MPLPQPHHRHRVRKRRRPHWDRPRHFGLSAILGSCVGLLMSWSFLKEYEQRPPVVLASSDSAAPNCPPVDCCVKP